MVKDPQNKGHSTFYLYKGQVLLSLQDQNDTILPLKVDNLCKAVKVADPKVSVI